MTQKFRIWDKRFRKMLYPKQLCFFGDHIGLPDYVAEQYYSYDELEQYGDEGLYLDNMLYLFDFDLMQWTGLQGVNNEKVFEKDIILSHFEYPDEKMVISAISDIWTANLDLSKIKVIGNIYENPELIQNQ